MEGGFFAGQLLIAMPGISDPRFERAVILVCAHDNQHAMGLALGMLLRESSPALRSMPLVLPVALYVVYTVRVLPGLRVFKHTFRGLGYGRAGLHRQSLLAFRRALQLDPNNPTARNGYWNVHCALDLDKLAREPQTLALVDFDLCLDRAGSLLLAPRPSPEKLAESNRLLDLVLSQRPAMKAPVAYWRAVAFTHAGDIDRAAAELEQVLDPAHTAADDPQRLSVLFQAWQLALLLHDGLRQRVGQPQLQKPGRRMEAIGVVERHLADQPEDATAWSLKRILYQDVTEAEYEAAAPGAGLPVQHFDHPYVQQLGLALINDPVRWQRGGEYLRLAARGLPALGPSIFVQIAQAQDYPTLEVRVDREKAATAGLTVRDVGVGLIPATSSSRFVSPTYWQDPKNGQSYLVQVQVPPPRMAGCSSGGVSPAAPYRHFSGREELLADVALRGMRRFEETLVRAWEAGRPDAATAFDRLGKAYLDFARGEPAYYSAMFEGGIALGSNPELRDASDRAFAVLREAAEKLSAQTQVGAKPPALMVALHIWAMTHGIASLFGRGDSARRALPMSAEELLEAQMLIYLRGLGISETKSGRSG